MSSTVRERFFDPGVIAWCVAEMSESEADDLSRSTDHLEGEARLEAVSEWIREHRPDLLATATPANCAAALMSWMRHQNEKEMR